jgi:uncharacterized protein YpuA (DUF1002 family)
LEVVVNTIMKLQESFIAQSTRSEMDVRQMICSLKPGLEASLGTTLNDEVERVLT